MTDRITYKHLDDLLMGLGFSRQRVEPKWLRYEHQGTELVIVVVAKGPTELVRVTDAVSARHHLVEKGLIGEKELDERLGRSSMAEALGRKA